MNPEQQRRVELAKIHIGKAQLRLDDDTYRALLLSIGNVTSAADLDARGRERVLAHMKARGATFVRGRRARPPAHKRALMAKVRALLANDQRPDAYADAMAKRMFGIARLEWLDTDQLRSVVAALTYDARRRARKEQK